MQLSDIMIAFRGLKREVDICKWDTLLHDHVVRHNQLAGLLLEYVEIDPHELMLDVTQEQHWIVDYQEILNRCFEIGEDKAAEWVWELSGEINCKRTYIIPKGGIKVECPKCGRDCYIFHDYFSYPMVGETWFSSVAECEGGYNDEGDDIEYCDHSFPVEYRILAKVEVRTPEESEG